MNYKPTLMSIVLATLLPVAYIAGIFDGKRQLHCPDYTENYRSVFMAGAQYAILVYDTTAHHPTEEQLNAGADSLENGTWQQHLEEIANQ